MTDEIFSGVNPPPYNLSNPDINKDESVYASLLESVEQNKKATEVWEEMRQEIDASGYSILVDKAKEKWELEQNIEAKNILTDIIEDPLVDVKIKEKKLKTYILNSKESSTNLKDRWSKELNDAFIVENNLDTTDEWMNADTEITDLYIEQAIERFGESVKNNKAGIEVENIEPEVFADRWNRLLDNWEQVKDYNFKGMLEGENRITDPGYIPLIDDVVFLASMAYNTPDYFMELVQTWGKGTGLTNQRAYLGAKVAEALGLNKLFPFLITSEEALKNLSSDRKKSYEKLREETVNMRKTAFTREVANWLDDFLKNTGLNPKNYSVVKMPFDVLGEAIDATAQASDDPGKTALALESMLLIALPYGIGKARNKINKKIKENQQKKAFKKANEFVGEEKVRAPDSDNPKVDTPFATTNVALPNLGGELFKELIEKPESFDNTIGLTLEQRITKMYDPIDNVYKTNEIGPIPDASVLAQIARAKKIEDRIALFDKSDPHIDLKIDYVYELAERTESILKDYKVIEADSLILLEPNPKGTGYRFGTAFRKSTTENFKDPKEVMAVYNDIVLRINENRGLSTDKIQTFPNEQTISIHEVLDRDGHFRPIEVYNDGIIPLERINKKDTNTSFIIRWNEETSFTKYYTEELTRTPEELYSSSFLGGIIPKILFKVLPGSNKFGVEGPVAYWFSSIGRFPKGIETPMRQSMLRVGDFTNQQRQIMLKNAVSRLGSRDQLMADKVLVALNKLGVDYPSLEMMKQILPPKMPIERQLLIQRAVYNYRHFLQSLWRYESSEAYNNLIKNGYDQMFIITDPASGKNQVLPVMKKFIIEEGKELGLIKETKDVYRTEVYHLDYHRMVPVILNKKHMFETGEVFNFVDGMPKQQIYRANHQVKSIVDMKSKLNTKLDFAEITSDYVMSDRFKDQPLQKNVIPYNAGHIPRINTDSIVIVAYPYKAKRNGHMINFLTGTKKPDLGPVVSNLIDLTTLKLSKNVREKRNEFITKMDTHSSVVGTFKSLKNARNFADANLAKMQKEYPNHAFVVKLGKDLQENTVRLHYEAEATTALSKSLRGNLLHWESVDGPLKSSIINSHSTGKKYLNSIAIGRMEEMFVKLYVTPGEKSVVNIKPNPEVTGLPGKYNQFPIAAEPYIIKKGNLTAEYNQAVALWNQINELKVGTPNRHLTDFVFNISKGFADKLENSSKFKNLIGKEKLVQFGRRTQRGAKEVESSLERALTFLKIRLNPYVMIIIQSPAALMNILVYGTKGNPVKIAENLKDAGRFFTVLMRQGFRERTSDKVVWDAFDKYLEGEKFPKLETEKSTTKYLGYKDKLTTNDFMLLAKEAKETGFLDVVNHELMSTLFSDKVIEFGEKQTSWNLTREGVRDLTVGMVNPVNVLKRGTKISGDFFTYSEAFSRIPQIIAALRNWQAKNPNKNWRNPNALREIFMDADLLAGSMHKYARYAYAKTTITQALGKFTYYVDKQREMLTNERARIGTAAEAWTAAIGWAGLSGTGLYGLYGTILNALESLYENTFDVTDEERYMKTWHRFAIIDLAVEYALTGEMNEGDRLLIGEKLSPSGGEGMQFGFKGNIWNLFASVITGNGGNDTNKGVTLGLLKQIFGPRGTLPTMWQLYFNPMLNKPEKAEAVLKVIGSYIPFVKNLSQQDIQLINNDLVTRSGHTMGIGGSKTDIILRTMFGLTTLDTQEMWKTIEDDNKRKKAYQESARIAVDTYFLIHKKQLNMEVLKEYTAAWVSALTTQGLIVDTAQGLEAIAEFESIIRRQDSSLVQTMVDRDIINMVMQEFYDPASVERLLKSAKYLENVGKYNEAAKARSRAEYMIDINKKYEKIKQKGIE